ncbi:hypothetical protein V3N99_08735 [Dermatophilaceae bacterium Soc4.6]
MSTTTAADLLDRAHALTRDLRRSDNTPTRGQWDAFDHTVHRLLTNLLGRRGCNIPHRSERRNQLLSAALTYPQPSRGRTTAVNLAPRSARPTGLGLVPETAAGGHLDATNDHGTSTATLPDLDLPSATDPDPLARLTCTLGALADLLVDASPWVVTSGQGDLADATTRVLSVAAVAGRHTLSVGNLDDADRVLAVGQWAERSIRLIGERSATTATLNRVTATLPDRASHGVNDRLETARVDWTNAAQAEVGRLIPSVDVLRVIANQGAHLYGLTAEMVQNGPGLAREAELVPDLADAARAFRAADRQWAGLTTLTRPTHEFLSESRRLLDALKAVAAPPTLAATAELDPERTLSDLVALAITTAELAAETSDLPIRLLRSHLLFGPVDRLADPLERLKRRTGTRAVSLGILDAPDLQARWFEAGSASRAAAHQLAVRHPGRRGPDVAPRGFALL